MNGSSTILLPVEHRRSFSRFFFSSPGKKEKAKQRKEEEAATKMPADIETECSPVLNLFCKGKECAKKLQVTGYRLQDASITNLWSNL